MMILSLIVLVSRFIKQNLKTLIESTPFRAEYARTVAVGDTKTEPSMHLPFWNGMLRRIAVPGSRNARDMASLL
jgi:hypothetical protein